MMIIGTKSSLITKLKECDIGFMKKFYSCLNDANKIYVQTKLLEMFQRYTSDKKKVLITVIEDIEIANEHILALNAPVVSKEMELELIKIMVVLFRARNYRIKASYLQFHVDIENVVYMESVLIPPCCTVSQMVEFLREQQPTSSTSNTVEVAPHATVVDNDAEEMLLVGEDNTGEDDRNAASKLFRGIKSDNLHRIYIPVRVEIGVNNNISCWIVIIYDNQSKTFFYVIPMHSSETSPICEKLRSTIEQIVSAWKIFLSRECNIQQQSFVAGVNGGARRWPYQYFDTQQDDIYSIFYIYSILYFLLNDCPLFCIINNAEARASLMLNISYSIFCDGKLQF